MIDIFKLTEVQIKLLCLSHKFHRILAYITHDSRGNSIEEMKEIINKMSNERINRGSVRLNKLFVNEISMFDFEKQWYDLKQLKQHVVPTLAKTYYFPGYCFQRKYKYIWQKGFEYRYARRVSIRAYLLACNRISIYHNININKDCFVHFTTNWQSVC